MDKNLKNQDDWYCQQCQQTIFKNKNVCLKCHSSRPDHWLRTHSIENNQRKIESDRFYDWTCPVCKAMIFGNKRYCFKCRLRNPTLPVDL